MLDNKAFGALIATRRREIGLTQDAFAHRGNPVGGTAHLPLK